jgi:hypothetical protein
VVGWCWVGGRVGSFTCEMEDYGFDGCVLAERKGSFIRICSLGR